MSRPMAAGVGQARLVSVARAERLALREAALERLESAAVRQALVVALAAACLRG
jgi:hypothetical protein